MLSRRLFAACALCGLTGFSATDAGADQTASPGSGLKRKILHRIDGPAEGYETVIVEATVEPGFLIPLHTHPGVESTYCIEGGGTLIVKNSADQTLAPGSSFQIAAYTAHSLRNGSVPTKLASTYVVEKDKPLASPA